MHSEEIDQIHNEIQKLEEEAQSCQNIPERLEKFDKIEVLDDRLFDLELQDLVTGIQTEVKNFFKGINV